MTSERTEFILCDSDQDALSDLTELSDSETHQSATVGVGADSDRDGDDSNESEGSEYLEEKKAPRRHKRPKTSHTMDAAPRKARTAKPNLKSAKKKSASRKSLSLLPTMPLDILFEVLGYMSPADLLNLARTAKNFREVLMTKRAVSLWRSARKQTPIAGTIAVECPPELSEPQWANLIWGGNTCQECGAKPVVNVSFDLRRRVCVRCMKEHLVKEPDFVKKFPAHDMDITRMILYTYVGAWTHGYATTTRYYWDDDIIRMGQTYGVYQKAVQLRQPNARINLEKFKQDRIKFVKEAHQHAREATEWYEEVAVLRYRNTEQIRDQRLLEMQDRLVGEGWNERDVRIALGYGRRAIPAKPLTEAAWRRSYPSLVKKIQTARDARLAAELQVIVIERKRALNNAYRGFLTAQARSSEALYYPNTSTLFEIPVLQEILGQPASVVVTEDNFTVAFTKEPFSTFIADWLRDDPRKKDFAMLLSGGMGQGGDTKLGSIGLNSARAVFRCTNISCQYGRLACGFQEAVMHEHPSPFISTSRPVDMTFEANLSMVVHSLIKALGLAESVTFRDLDACGAWFTCTHCAIASGQKYVMTWRQCLYHYKSLEKSHGDPSSHWQLLSVSQPDPRDKFAGWSCDHCNHFLSRKASKPFAATDQCGTKTDVLNHIKEIHGILSPVTDKDLWWHPGSSFLPAVITPSRPEEGSIFRCSHCVTKTRSFQLRGVKDHLRAKHQVGNAVMNTDYFSY